MKRRRARRGEGHQLRAEIVARATELLAEHGSEEEVSIQMIVDAVGVTPPSLYLHFENKNDLFFAVCEQQFIDFNEALNSAVADIESPLQSLACRGFAYLEWAVANPEQYRILMMHRPHELPERVDMGVLLLEAGFGALVDDVTVCTADGLIDGDPFQVAVTMWSTAHGLAALTITFPYFPWPELRTLAASQFRTALIGLGVPSGDAAAVVAKAEQHCRAVGIPSSVGASC